MENYFIIEDETYVGVKFKEYKELLIIKGKYEELKNTPILKFGEANENETIILPCKDIKTTDPFSPPYKITCNKEV